MTWAGRRYERNSRRCLVYTSFADRCKEASLVAFFAERGEPVAELGLDVTRDALEDWNELWRGTLEDAELRGRKQARSSCFIPRMGESALLASGEIAEQCGGQGRRQG